MFKLYSPKFLLTLIISGLLFSPLSHATWFSPNKPCTDLWCVMRLQFKLPDASQNPAVKKQIHWFASHPSYLRLMANRAKPYLFYIYSEVNKRHMPAEIALLPMIESAYNPFAYSKAGAAGLWQLMPGTASGYGVKQDWWYDGRRDVLASTHTALGYLAYLNVFFHHRWLLAIAAYDSGEGTVQNALKYNKTHHLPTDFWHLPLPKETQAYVPRLLALATIIKHPEQYGIHLPSIPNQAYFKKVSLHAQIDLARVATLAHIKLTDLYALNPGFNRWATDPNGPYSLVLPVDSVSTFTTNLALLPKKKRVTWTRHTVNSGDSLNKIAHHYHTKVDLVKKINQLKTNIIRPKQVLLIPKQAKHLDANQIQHERNYVISHTEELGPQQLLHTIKRGDTYGRLAKKYHVKPAAVRFWNHLSYGQPLQLGQKIMIWTRKASHAHTIHNPGKAVVKRYKVKSHDTLSAIAHHWHVDLKQIEAWNNIKDPQRLKVGQIIKIVKKP